MNRIVLLRASFDSHCQKLGTRWRLRVRTKVIMAANSYKKMYGDKETTVSVKMVGTLWGLLVPSMLVYKIW